MEVDAHCLEIIQAYVQGKITREEADQELKKHGDLLTFELLNNGFQCVYCVDTKDWKNVIGGFGN